MKNLAYRCLASCLALLLAVNTPVFGRWATSCWSSGGMGMAACQPVDCLMPCPPAPACCDPCGVVVESSPCGCESATPMVTETPASDCGCEGSATVVHEDVYAPVMPQHDHHGHEHHATQEPTVAAPPVPTPAYEPAPSAFGNGFRSDQPKPEVVEADAPSDDWDAGFEEPVAPAEEPAEVPAAADMPMFDEPAEEPADDLFGDTPIDEPTQEEMPADDLFGAPADEPVAESLDPPPADDLFGGEPMEAPAEETPADDLFGGPADEPAAADDDLFGGADEEPAAEDDLFGGAADEPADAGDDLFGEPADAPMEEEPAAPADDLFGGEDNFEPASEPADDLFDAPTEEAPADDLFGEEPAAEAPAAEDDLFGVEEAAEEPADAADDLFGGEEDSADDLFGEPEEAPAEDAAEDDLFGGFGAILSEPGGVESARDRTWIDNTGRHSTVGRLIAIDGGAVRLAKRDGGVASVPLGRLSQADLEFVSRQAIAMTEAREWAIAHGKPADKDAPKQARSQEKMPLRTAQL